MKIEQEFRALTDYAVVDIETTGINCSTNDIIEISALKIDGGEIADSFSELVYTSKIIDPFIVNLTGIDNSMLKDADDISSVLCRFFDFAEDRVIVGHNIGFDMRFISHQAQLNFGFTPSNKTLDTLKLSREALPQLKCHKLSYLKDYFGIEGVSHRALSDCTVTYELIQKILNLR
ncbi:MAG: 3'-5' exonuclease [Clostridia bacterium]|nr:3'-5' exonuclease [Clostridia bacterium]